MSLRRSLPILIVLFAGPAGAVPLEGHSLKITGEVNREFEITAPKNAENGQNVLVVRPRDDDDPEVIANGKMVKSGAWKISIDWERIKKRPEKGDFVVPLGAPKKFAERAERAKEKHTDFTMRQEEKIEPGYIRFGLTRWGAKLTSSNPDPANRTNSLKNIPKYDMTGLEIDWFVDFLPNYGLYLSKSSQAVPVKTYVREETSAVSDRIDLRLQYRNTKVDTKWRWVAALAVRSDSFATSNPDEWIVSTNSTTAGLAFTFAYEPGNPLFSAPKTSMQWLTTGATLIFSPMVTAADGVLKRGQGSSGSTTNELHVFSEWTFHLNWMPYFKRYFVRLDYINEEGTYKFSGATTQDSGNLYRTPENGVYVEKRQGLMVSVGLRFEDYIGKIFKPRN